MYILKKELPNVSIGAEITLSNLGTQYRCKDKNGFEAVFNRKLIENNPEWFYEVPSWQSSSIYKFDDATLIGFEVVNVNGKNYIDKDQLEQWLRTTVYKTHKQ